MLLLLENMAIFKRISSNFLIMILIQREICHQNLKIHFNSTNKKNKMIIKKRFLTVKVFNSYKKKILMILNKQNKVLIATFKLY